MLLSCPSVAKRLLRADQESIVNDTNGAASLICHMPLPLTLHVCVCVCLYLLPAPIPRLDRQLQRTSPKFECTQHVWCTNPLRCAPRTSRAVALALSKVFFSLFPFEVFLLVFYFSACYCCCCLSLLYFYINYVRNSEAIDIFMRLLWVGTRDLLTRRDVGNVSAAAPAAKPQFSQLPSLGYLPPRGVAVKYLRLSVACWTLRVTLKKTETIASKWVTKQIEMFCQTAYLGSHGVCFIYTHLSQVFYGKHKSLGLSPRLKNSTHALGLCLPFCCSWVLPFNGLYKKFISNYVCSCGGWEWCKMAAKIEIEL